MFLSLWAHELRQHALRFRFAASAVLLVLAPAIGAVVYDPPRVVESSPPQGRQRLFAFVQGTDSYRLDPGGLGFVVSGRTKYLPNQFTYGPMRSREIETGLEIRENLFSEGFNDLDWVFMVGTLAAFITLALTFDAVPGERERGQLKLLLSFSVSRKLVLWAKYLATLIVVLFPLTAGFALALLILRIRGVLLPPDGAFVLAGFAFLSVLAISFHAWLGLWISSSSRSSEASLILLTLVFAFSTIIWPSLSAVISRQWVRIPSSTEIEARVDSLYRGVPRRSDAATNLALRQRILELRQDFRRRQLEQAELGTALACLSPYYLLVDATMDLSGIGLWRIDRTIGNIGRHIQTLDEFILAQDRADPESRQAGLVHYKTLGRKPIDVNRAPVFRDTAPSLAERSFRALPNVLVLLIANLAAFALSLRMLMRCDIR